MSEPVEKIDVISEYLRICGIEPDENRDREATIALIKAALPDFSEFDEFLLNQTEPVDSDTVAAKWLRGNRQPIPMAASLGVSIRVRTPMENHFIGNLQNDRGGVEFRLTVLLTEKSAREVAEVLLHEGYSLSEVVSAFSKKRYDISLGAFGAPEYGGVPGIRLSKNPRTKEWWQLWKTERADLTMSEPLLWELTLEEAKALNRPVIVVRLPKGEVEIETTITSEDVVMDFKGDAPTEGGAQSGEAPFPNTD